MDSQGTKCRRNIAENFNRLSRAHEHYRQTDDRRTGDSTFAKNWRNDVLMIRAPQLTWSAFTSRQIGW